MSHILRRGHNGKYGQGMRDFAGRQGHASLFGETVVGSHIDDVSLQFQYNNSANDVKEIATGTGASSNADSMAKVSTGAGVGLNSLVSLNSIRYRAGHEAFAQMTFRFRGLAENVTHFVGIGNGEDRIGIGSQDGIVGIWFLEGSNRTFIPQADWVVDRLDGEGGKGNQSGFDLDVSMLNIVMPSYGWLGSAPLLVSFYCGFALGWVVAHVIDVTNKVEEPHLKNPTLPLQMEVERTAGTGEATIQAGSWRGGSIAASGEEADAASRVFTHKAISVAVPASLVPTVVLSLKNKVTFHGKENHVVAKPITITIITDGTKDVLVQGVKNPTTSPALSYTDVNTDNSVMQFAVGPETLTAPIPIPPGGPGEVFGKVETRVINTRERKVTIYPGEELAIVASSLNSTAVSVSVTVEELF